MFVDLKQAVIAAMFVLLGYSMGRGDVWSLAYRLGVEFGYWLAWCDCTK